MTVNTVYEEKLRSKVMQLKFSQTWMSLNAPAYVTCIFITSSMFHWLLRQIMPESALLMPVDF